MGKPAVQTVEVSNLLPHYPWTRLTWRTGDIKVEEARMALSQCVAPSSLTECAIWEHTDPDAETGRVKNEE